MNLKAYRVRTAEGSKFLVRFEPKIEKDGILYGHATVVGYSEVMQNNLRIVGIAPVPEPEGHIIVHDRPWAIESVEGTSVPLYEYETITIVDDVTHLLERLNDKVEEETKQEV